MSNSNPTASMRTPASKILFADLEAQQSSESDQESQFYENAKVFLSIAGTMVTRANASSYPAQDSVAGELSEMYRKLEGSVHALKDAKPGRHMTGSSTPALVQAPLGPATNDKTVGFSEIDDISKLQIPNKVVADAVPIQAADAEQGSLLKRYLDCVACAKATTGDLRELDLQRQIERLDCSESDAISDEGHAERELMRRNYETRSRQLRQDLQEQQYEMSNLRRLCEAYGIDHELPVQWWPDIDTDGPIAAAEPVDRWLNGVREKQSPRRRSLGQECVQAQIPRQSCSLTMSRHSQAAARQMEISRKCGRVRVLSEILMAVVQQYKPKQSGWFTKYKVHSP